MAIASPTWRAVNGPISVRRRGLRTGSPRCRDVLRHDRAGADERLLTDLDRGTEDGADGRTDHGDGNELAQRQSPSYLVFAKERLYPQRVGRRERR